MRDDPPVPRREGEPTPADATEDLRARAVRQRFRRAIATILLGFNVVGAFLASLLLLLVIPLPEESREPAAVWGTTALAVSYAAIATVAGIWMGLRILEPVQRWLVSDGLPDEATQRRVLAAPLMFTRRTALLWAGGAFVAAGYNVWFDPLLGLVVGMVLGLSGLVVCTVTFLVSERALRPLASRALAERAPRSRLDRALLKRLVFTWLLSSGAGLLGVAVASVVAILRPSLTTLPGFAVTILVLAVVVSATGLTAIVLVSRATAEPVEDLINALGAVEAGQLDARVRVWDSTELGVLQSGFNAMMVGLQERERLRDLFGRHVGEDVATAALLDSVSFEGEVREVAVLFVDLVGSTTMAEATEPSDIIGLLNKFFDIVIDVVHDHDGWINKFQGDAALAVWGAPLDVSDHATKSLSAARNLRDRLGVELPGLSVGIGLSGGLVVTGNVGGSSRYEYTAIGDPVNEAARLTEIAKELPQRILANAELLDASSPEERLRWREVDPVVVRGRTAPTRVAIPTPPDMST